MVYVHELYAKGIARKSVIVSVTKAYIANYRINSLVTTIIGNYHIVFTCSNTISG